MALTVGALAAVTACGGSPEPGASSEPGTGALGGSPSSAATTAATTVVTTPAAAPTTNTANHSAGNPLACSQLPNAKVGTATIPLADYDPGAVTLVGGTYTDGIGRTIELQ